MSIKIDMNINLELASNKIWYEDSW